ncbi:hypothetical protein [Burkholderia vietnamiensis]|uniref:hypothetical protein n=1 Tax=Burkholderia vietnamiensis TaxID=60552 RepID=UPI00158B9F73|nr:hypothetical protein [Burkholderia vietnamiensis]
MPADRLGRYMSSAEFLRRANEAVAEAVHELESHGIQPVYRDRKTGQIIGGGDETLHENDACEDRDRSDILNDEDPNRGTRK